MLTFYKSSGQTDVESLMILNDPKMLSKYRTVVYVLGHLKLAVSRSGLVGLQQLCKESVNGKARVTIITKIITKLFDYLKD